MEIVRIKGPYNFEQVLDRMSLDPLNVVDMENKYVKVPLMIDDEPVVVEVKGTGTTDEPEFHLFNIDHDKRDKIIERLAFIFQWNVPLSSIHSHFEQTDLKPIFEQYRGMPLVLDFDPYRCLLKCIIHQQLNMAFAYTLSTRFAKQFGFEKEGVYFYPDPETVAALKVEDLRKLQFSNRKGEYVIGVAQAIVDGKLNLAELSHKSDEEIMKELTKLRGVGPWTVQNLLLFGFGRKNLFPMADIGLQNALKELYDLGRKPTFSEMEQYKKPWEPYLSYASIYLWRSIE